MVNQKEIVTSTSLIWKMWRRHALTYKMTVYAKC